MRFLRRILIYILILGVIIGLITVSYFYAYKKTKKELVSFLYKKWGDRVEIESYNFNPLKGLFFEKIEVKGLFKIKRLKISYDILSLVKKKSIAALSIDTLVLSSEIFENKSQIKDTDNKFSIPFSFEISNFNVNFLKFLHSEKSYEIQNIRGFLRVEKNGKFISLLDINFLHPYTFYMRTLITGNTREQDFKILNFRNKIFDVSGEVNVSLPFLKFKLRNLKTSKFNFDYVEGKLKIKDKDIDIIFIEAKEKRGELTLSGEVKNYRDLDRVSFQTISYIKGEYFFKKHKFDFELINEIDFKKKLLRANIYVEDLKIDDLHELKGFSMLNFSLAKKSFAIDTFKINYRGVDLYAKGFFPGEIKIGIDISEENKIDYLKGSRGKVLGIYRNDLKSYTFVIYGDIKNFSYNNLRIPRFDFSVGREETGENFITFNFDSLFYKQNLLGGVRLNLKGEDTLFFFNLDVNTPFAGNFEDKGVLIMGKNYYTIRDSLNKLKAKFSNGIFEVSLNGIELWEGKIFSNTYFDIKNKGVMLLLGARNLHMERIELKRNVLLSGIFNIDLDIKGKIEAFNLNASISTDTLLLNDVLITHFLANAYGDQNRVTLDIKSRVMDEGFLKAYGVFDISQKEILNKNYEFEIAAEKLPLKEFQKFLNLRFINFNKGRIFANFKLKKGNLDGDILIEKGEGEILYTLSPFYNMFLFLNIRNNKIDGRFNGYSGEGDFRAKIEGKIEKRRFENFKISVNFNKAPVFYNFIDSKLSGKFDFSINKDIKNIILDSKIEEAYIVPAFKKEEGGKSPSDLFFDLKFNGDGRIFLFNEWIDAELKGDLRVKKYDPVNYYISGELEVIQGKIFYLGNVFEIKEGKIFFPAGSHVIPEIDLQAELPYTVEDENFRIILKINGSLNEPVFKIYSEPVVFDQSTLIKYLTFGQTQENPFSEIGIKGMNIGEKLLSAQVKKNIRISEFSLINKGSPSILLGTYLSPKLYVKYQHDFLSYYKDAFLIRYFLNPRFSLYSKRERTGEMVTGLELEFRF